MSNEVKERIMLWGFIAVLCSVAFFYGEWRSKRDCDARLGQETQSRLIFDEEEIRNSCQDGDTITFVSVQDGGIRVECHQ